jgi:pyruvate formate lyase activating enzyme
MSAEGIVFDIQRFSVHDGPGIRTLVFLKGCPLRCPWCSNPESQRFEPELFFDPARCIGCRKCVEVCPRQASTFIEGRLSFDHRKCLQCGRCAEVCYAEARTVKGRPMTTDQVLSEVIKDSAFYTVSGGGLTLGGGEPFSQAEFAAALLKGCGAKGIHTAVETAGPVPWSHLEGALPHIDLFLYDLKHMDPEKHSRATGADNRLILENLERLARSGAPLILRTPVIPGFNDTVPELKAILRHGRSLGIGEMHLLPFHAYGKAKHRFLGRPCPAEEMTPLSEGDMDRFKGALSREGLRIRVGG